MRRLFRTYWNLLRIFFEGVCRVQMKKKWGGKRRKSFYREMWGNTLEIGGGRGGGGHCENLVRLSKCDSPIETIEYIWVSIWSILDWILSQNSRNILPLHRVDQSTSKDCKYKRYCAWPVAWTQCQRCCWK